MTPLKAPLFQSLSLTLLLAPAFDAFAVSGFQSLETEKQPLEANWEESLGDEDTVALYGSFDWGHDAGAVSTDNRPPRWSTQCGGGLEAGVVFRNQRKSVVKILAEGRAAESGTRAGSEVFAFGKTIWKSQGPGTAPAKSVKAEFDGVVYPLIPGVLTARVTGYSQAEIGLNTGLRAEAKTLSCVSTATPSAKSVIGATVKLDVIGFGDVSLGSFGVGGQVKAFDLKLPTQGGIAQKTGQLEEQLKSEVSLGYLDGKIFVSLDTRIPLKGEKKWDWDKDTFKWTIFDWKGKSSREELLELTQKHPL
jgi:hypothetical protein